MRGRASILNNWTLAALKGIGGKGPNTAEPDRSG
jgi:hypothetical protein